MEEVRHDWPLRNLGASRKVRRVVEEEEAAGRRRRRDRRPTTPGKAILCCGNEREKGRSH